MPLFMSINGPSAIKRKSLTIQNTEPYNVLKKLNLLSYWP